MPRCFVVVDRTGRLDLAETLGRAHEAMVFGGSLERSFLLVRPPFAALVLSHHAATPFHERDGEVVVDMGLAPDPESRVGFLDDCAASLAAAEGVGPRLEPPSRSIGRRCLMRWSPARRELLVAGEPNGQLPLYYSHSSERVMVTSEPKAIASESSTGPRPDTDGLLELFATGQLLGERSLFRDVHGVGPGQMLGFTPGGLASKTYHSFSFSDLRSGDCGRFAADLNRSLDGVLHDCREAAPRVTVALSGGMDSRYLLAGARRVWDTLDSITFGAEDSRDVALAREVARIAGIPHRHIAPAESFLADWAGYSVWRTDGMLNCIHAHGMDAVIACSAESRHILNGAGGDLLLGAFLRPAHLFQSGDPDRAARYIISGTRAPAPPPERVFKPEVLSQATTRPDVTLAEIMRRYPHERMGNVLLSFWLRHRCARVTAFGLALEAPFVEYLTPLLDPAFVRETARLPLELRFMSRAHRRALGLLAPDLMSVPWERIGLAPRWPWPVLALGKLGRRLGWIPRPRPIVDYAEQLRSSLKPWLDGLLLDRATLENGYFLPSYLREMVNQHARGERDRTSEIGLAVTIELWRRIFIEKDLSRAAPPRA
jgi:hypothetical protein